MPEKVGKMRKFAYFVGVLATLFAAFVGMVMLLTPLNASVSSRFELSNVEDKSVEKIEAQLDKWMNDKFLHCQDGNTNLSYEKLCAGKNGDSLKFRISANEDTISVQYTRKWPTFIFTGFEVPASFLSDETEIYDLFISSFDISLERKEHMGEYRPIDR